MIRSTKKIMVSSENFDFEFSAFLTADPKKHVYFYFVAFLTEPSFTGWTTIISFLKKIG